MEPFSFDEAKKLAHGQAVLVKAAEDKFVPATIQGDPMVTKTAVYLDVLTAEQFRMKVHFAFIRKPE